MKSMIAVSLMLLDIACLAEGPKTNQQDKINWKLINERKAVMESSRRKEQDNKDRDLKDRQQTLKDCYVFIAVVQQVMKDGILVEKWTERPVLDENGQASFYTPESSRQALQVVGYGSQKKRCFLEWPVDQHSAIDGDYLFVVAQKGGVYRYTTVMGATASVESWKYMESAILTASAIVRP